MGVYIYIREMKIQLCQVIIDMNIVYRIMYVPEALTLWFMFPDLCFIFLLM